VRAHGLLDKNAFLWYNLFMKNLDKIKEKINPILEKSDVSQLFVFGSFARGEETKDSDLDLIVEFNKEKSLFDLAGLQLELEEALNKKVDLLTPGGIYHRLRERIEKESIRIF